MYICISYTVQGGVITKYITYGPYTTVGQFMHEIRHFLQAKSRNFEDVLGDWHKNLLKEAPFHVPDKTITQIVENANKDELGKFIGLLEEFDAHKFTVDMGFTGYLNDLMDVQRKVEKELLTIGLR